MFLDYGMKILCLDANTKVYGDVPPFLRFFPHKVETG